MQESNSLRADRKSRRKTASYFSTESPESFLFPLRSVSAVESVNDSEEKTDQPKETIEDNGDDEDLMINVEGMDIDNLALDGAAAMNALNDVLQKIGIDVSGGEAPAKHSKNMSPWEIKSNIQTQIIVHLGRRMEKMQEVVDDLNAKLSATITQKHRIKMDRDETRARLVQATAELKETKKLLKESGSNRIGLFDETNLINSVLSDLIHNKGIKEEPSKVLVEDFIEIEKETVKNETDEDETLEELLEIHSNTKDQLRKVIAIMQVRKKYGPPTKLGVGLKSLIADDDIMCLNPFRGSLRTPYKLDASNYQPQEARKLIRQAKNQVEHLFTSMAARHQQLSNAKDHNEKILILEEQSAQSMDSLSVCLDLLCEEQVYAWKWRSRCKALGRQLEEIRSLFSRVNLEASRIVRKEQRMIGSILYKEYIRSSASTPSRPSASKNPNSQNLASIRLKRMTSFHSRSIPRNISSHSTRSEYGPPSDARSSRPHTGMTVQSMDRVSLSSNVSFPEVEQGYIPSIDF